jgi:hypothetical protein
MVCVLKGKIKAWDTQLKKNFELARKLKKNPPQAL